ncbi:hypothetical protein [Flavobacterium sp. J27]|uniref:hypothetical protein n=1 Tax=Flavobacterium sp. J27 TaxID=2060419 RepID=UPI001030E04D|nr:hypothetical protein [Flavobacterium sp. J27]
MNKIIAIFLISIFLCANTSIGQLLKIPNLIAHYNEHKTPGFADTTVSFFQFLKEHYSKNAKIPHKKHQDLPFKNFDTSANLLFTVTFMPMQIVLKTVFFETKNRFFYNKSLQSNLFFSIWLPPKIA